MILFAFIELLLACICIACGGKKELEKIFIFSLCCFIFGLLVFLYFKTRAGL